MEKKFIKAEKMESSDNENSIVGWASKPTMDRDRELILADAWQLDNYRKNPVIMLAHDYHTLPIGKCLWVKATDSGLRFKCKFANTDRGKEVYSLYKDKFLNGFSVGFKPRPGGVVDNPSDVKYKGVKRLFTDVELMEISCVPIPANQDAMVDQNSFIKYVKDGNIVTKGLKEEMEAIIEIIEKSDDTLEIEVKATDELTNTEIKIESTDNFVHVPAPGEEGKHKDCKIRTITISKKDGIQAHYCVDDKIITGYIFDKQNEKKWDEKTAVKWVEDHKKELNFEVSEDETEVINIKSENAFMNLDGDWWFADDLETKSVTPNADEAEKDFMARCMGDKSMAKMNEGFRANACKMMWKKNQPEKKDAKVIEEKAAFAKKDDETEDEFVARFLGDEKTTADYPDEKDRIAAAKEEWAKGGDKQKKEPEQAAVITKMESVQDFIKRVLPDKSIEIKTAEELAQVFEKSLGYDEMKETVGAMEAQSAGMEPVPNSDSSIAKSADEEGNPSLYDLTGAVDRVLNPVGQDRGFPSSINDTINPLYRSVIDIFAVNYPSGHVVYSEYDKTVGQSKYFQIEYEYDLKMRVATIIGEPEEVLQSWVTDRYMIEKDEEEIEHMDEEVIEVKTGRMISAKNKKVLADCMAQMMAAHAAMEEMMIMAEEKSEDEIEEKEEFEIIEKEEDHIEFDLEAPVEKADDGFIEIDDEMIKKAVATALGENSMKVDTKGVAEEVLARLTGRATLK